MTDNSASISGGDGARGYSLFMKIIHWLTAICMIIMLAAGIYMVNGFWDGKFPPERGQLYDIHRGLGIVLFFLVIIRLVAYRFSTPPSPLPPTMSPAQRAFSSSVHFLLYAALLIQPIFGWYATNTWGVAKIPVFGLFNLPTLAEKNRELGNLLLEIHGYAGLFVTALIALHITAALVHHFVWKDGVLNRMLRS